MFRPMIRILKKESNVRRVESEYRLTKTLLGESRWQVFKGRDTKRDIDVAVKIVKGQTLAHELKAHKKVQPIIHPHLIRVLDLSVQDDELWVILEYVDQDQYFRLSEMSWPSDRNQKQLKLINIALQLLDALSVLSAHGLIHDDVKPENILVKPCPDGYHEGDFARLLDYGSVCSFETQNITKTRFYSQGYSAPDQFPPDNRRDSFSTARVLTELVLGHLPAQEMSHSDRVALNEKAPVLGPILVKALCTRSNEHEMDVEEFANHCRDAKRILQVTAAKETLTEAEDVQIGGGTLAKAQPVSDKRWTSVLDLTQKNLETARRTGELLRKKLDASQRVNRGTTLWSFFSIVSLVIGLISVSLYCDGEMDRQERRIEAKNTEIERLEFVAEELTRAQQELRDRNFDLVQSLKARAKAKELGQSRPESRNSEKRQKTPF
ncbi:MAG: protein kinase [Planctomycetota bacterium]|nr:protein kinase [Planctomycetota bacterium]